MFKKESYKIKPQNNNFYYNLTTRPTVLLNKQTKQLNDNNNNSNNKNKQETD